MSLDPAIDYIYRQHFHVVGTGSISAYPIDTLWNTHREAVKELRDEVAYLKLCGYRMRGGFRSGYHSSPGDSEQVDLCIIDACTVDHNQ